MLTPQRNFKLKELARKRQNDLCVVLENVHDPHNIGAVMRTCDACGIPNIFVIYTEDGINSEKEYIGINASQGTKKWVKCHFFKSIKECMNVVQSRYDQIIATHLSVDGKSLYEYDFTKSSALVFGNESKGLSENILKYCTSNMFIPMMGMAQSLNISVAAAVSIYEALRQRQNEGYYDKPFNLSNTEMKESYKDGIENTYPKVFEIEPEKLDEVVNEFGKSDSDTN